MVDIIKIDSRIVDVATVFARYTFAVYQEKGCGIMIDRESVFILNPAMDVTDTVIQRLNAQLPTLSFNRMPVPAQPQS